MPKKGAGGTSAKKAQLSKRDKAMFTANFDEETCGHYPFFADSKDADLMQPLVVPDIEQWVRSETDPRFVAQKKAFEGSFMTSRRIPIHAGYHNLANLEGFHGPKWWMKDDNPIPEEDWFAVVAPQTEAQSAERAQKVTEAATRRAKGQTLAYILEVNNKLANSDYIAILNYGSAVAFGQHTDCESKFPFSSRDNRCGPRWSEGWHCTNGCDESHHDCSCKACTGTAITIGVI